MTGEIDLQPYYTVLGLPVGAGVQQAQEAFSAIKASGNTERTQAAEYAVQQITKHYLQQKPLMVDPVESTERARTGCGLAILVVVGLVLRGIFFNPPDDVSTTYVTPNVTDPYIAQAPVASDPSTTPVVEEAPPASEYSVPNFGLTQPAESETHSADEAPMQSTPETVQSNDAVETNSFTPEAQDTTDEASVTPPPGDVESGQQPPSISTPPIEEPSSEPFAAAPTEVEKSPTQIGSEYGPPKLGYFTLGSSKAQVRQIMGAPRDDMGSFWMYGLDTVHFQDGFVSSYSNTSGELKVDLRPKHAISATSFTIGDSRDVVLAVMGAPRDYNESFWMYGLDTVHFQAGRVSAYSNTSGELKVVLKLSKPIVAESFSIGDSQDVVLAVMGAPRDYNESFWMYGLDIVHFQNGRVSSFTNTTGGLKVR